jgi:HD superfamily phosphohydrolase
MKPPKAKFIKDLLWGSVPILPWEEVLVEHPIYSRLHNVLQNSTAYRVYPSLRVTRFAHSIGVCYVAGQLYSACIANSDNDSVFGDPASTGRTSLLSEAKQLIQMAHVPQDALDFVDSIFRSRLPLALDGHSLPDSNKLYFLFAVVRLAGLLHDVGHLPYSHVFEFALKHLLLDGDSKRLTNKTTRGLLSTLAPSDSSAKYQFHETVGMQLISFLSEITSAQAANSSRRSSSDQHLWKYTAHLIRATGIFMRQKEWASTSIISGVSDADRIDFVRRDTFSSGLSQSAIDYGRLFGMYHLEVTENPKLLKVLEAPIGSKPSVFASPGKRSKSDLEKLLIERFHDYKYIACHHRVHLGDELLERVIISLVQASYLDPLIFVLKNLLLRGEDSSSEFAELGESHAGKVIALLTEFDDFWLEAKIREAYRDIISKKGKFRSIGKFGEAVITRYIEGTQTHKSLFSSDDEFWHSTKDTKMGKLLKEPLGKGGWHKLLPADDMFWKNTPGSEIGELAKECRAKESEQGRLFIDILDLVNKKKYSWERAFFEKHGQLVILGDVSNKLKIGFKPEDAIAVSINLTGVGDYLSAKIEETPPFNFWYPKHIHNITSASVLNNLYETIFGKLHGYQEMHELDM